jgi:hypothetical protein
MEQYLSSFRNGLEKVYYLNKEGREMVDAETVRKRTNQIDHFLMRNQLFIELGRPSTWETEIKLKVHKGLYVICDAKFERNGRDYIVEVDCQQSMKRNARKIEKYKEIRRLTRGGFKLIWVTGIDSRKQKLARLCQGLPFAVYTFNEIK